MAAYPGAIASFAGFTSTHTLAADNHAAQHNLEQGEIVAVQTKVGTGASTPAANQVLKGGVGGSSSWGPVILSSDVTGVLPVANGGTGGNTPADARTALGLNTQLEILAAVYPVGSIYTNAVNDTNPATLLGFGTWSAFASGRVMVGVDTGQTEFDTIGETGGAKTHTLTIGEMPSHDHTWNSGQATGTAGGISGVALNNAGFNISGPTSLTGGGGAHNNLQPYITVYMWRRTA